MRLAGDVPSLLERMQSDLLARAVAFRDSRTHDVS